MGAQSWITVRVAAKRHEAVEIVSYDLVDAQERDLPVFSAGSHIDVEIRPGLVRQYSLYSPPSNNRRYSIAVLRESASRGGSSAMHEIAEGQMLRISPPRNHFPLAAAARHSVLVAGGIGITPILCMAQELADSS